MKRLIYCCGVAISLLFTANALIAFSDDDPMEERTEVPAPHLMKMRAIMKETTITITVMTMHPWKEIL